MKLFLASHASHPESMKKLESFLGGFAKKSIAYIPTAANGEHPYGSWQTESDTWKLINTLGAFVTPVVLEEYRDSSVIEALRDKDVVWINGGMCGYLLYWLRRCEVDRHMTTLLERSVYVGSSAG